jgi:hypothetical protein
MRAVARRRSRVGNIVPVEALLIERLRRLRREDVVGSGALCIVIRQRI